MESRSPVRSALLIGIAITANVLIVSSMVDPRAPVTVSQADQQATDTPTGTAAPTVTGTPTRPVTLTPTRTRTPSVPMLYLPRLHLDTGWISAPTIMSSCARIDRVPGKAEFAVCALRRDYRPQDNVWVPCSVKVSVSTGGCPFGPESLSLVLEPDPSFMAPGAVTLVFPVIPPGDFWIPAAALEPHTVYRATVTRSCGGVDTERLVGHFGLCDPGGRANVIDSVGGTTPLVGAEVTLSQYGGMPDIGASPNRDCRTSVTRGSPPAFPPAAAVPANAYWNNWSQEPVMPPGGAPGGPLNPIGNPQLTLGGGIYGWVAPKGCYQVHVDPASAGYSPAILPPADSPVVGDEPLGIPPSAAVDDLDITYYFEERFPNPMPTRAPGP